MAQAPPLKIIHVAATPTGAPWMVALMREQKRLGHDVAAIIPARDGGIGAQLDGLGEAGLGGRALVGGCPQRRRRAAGWR